MERLINLTPNEFEILQHRLEMPDTLAQVMFDTYVWDVVEVEEAARKLYERVKLQRGIDYQNLTVVERELLHDCLDGSTFFAGMPDEVALGRMTRQKQAALHRAADSLEEKFARLGLKAFIPRS